MALPSRAKSSTTSKLASKQASSPNSVNFMARQHLRSREWNSSFPFYYLPFYLPCRPFPLISKSLPEGDEGRGKKGFQSVAGKTFHSFLSFPRRFFSLFPSRSLRSRVEKREGDWANFHKSPSFPATFLESEREKSKREGEKRREPFSFLYTYLWFVPPCISGAGISGLERAWPKGELELPQVSFFTISNFVAVLLQGK